MKNARCTYVIAAFVLTYAVLLGLGGECLLCLLAGASAISVDAGESALFRYFLPLCKAAGLLSLCALAGVGVLNARVGRRAGYTKPAWVIQWVCVGLIFLPGVYLWEQIFHWLLRIV